MLWTIFVILLVLWLLGVVSSYTLGGFIHILLVVALVVLLIQLIRDEGRFNTTAGEYTNRNISPPGEDAGGTTKDVNQPRFEVNHG